MRRALIVSQVALSLVLLVAALLFVRTFRNLLTLDAGFQQSNLLIADFDFSTLQTPPASRLQYKRQLLARVRNTPGVISASETNIVPLSGDGWNEFIDIPGTSISRKSVDFSAASGGYFQTLQTPLIAGRDFADNDTPASPLVAIVNQRFAQTYLGDANPIGKVFQIRQSSGQPAKVYQIVGLVGNTKYRDLREDFNPVVFVSEGQISDPGTDSIFIVRSTGSTSTLISSLKAAAATVSPEIVLNFSVLRTSVLDKLTRERLMATLSGFYGVLAAILAMIGIYGIISYMVVRRRNEIGIRIALGSGKAMILRMILREALVLLAIGLAGGIALSVAAGSAARAMLFGLKPVDPLTLILAVGSLAIVAVAASLFPAISATAVDPIQVLREE